MGIEFIGTEKFEVLARKLRAAERELPGEVRKAVDKGARPLPAAAERSALTNLPHRGGLNALVARARFSVRRTSSTTLEVRAKGIDQLSQTNAGRVTHPTYGHRPRITQSIPRARDWFFRPMRKGKGKVEDEIGDALHRVAKEIT